MPAARPAGGPVAGKAYPPVEVPIRADSVAAFARALGVDPEEGVPPTFAAVYALEATAPQLFGDPEAAIDFARLLHAEQEFSWERHPRVGETVTARGRVVADLERRGARFVTYETTCTAGEDLLCTSRARFVIGGA